MIDVAYFFDLQRHIFVHKVNITVYEQMCLEVEQAGVSIVTKSHIFPGYNQLGFLVRSIFDKRVLANSIKIRH